MLALSDAFFQSETLTYAAAAIALLVAALLLLLIVRRAFPRRLRVPETGNAGRHRSERKRAPRRLRAASAPPRPSQASGSTVPHSRGTPFPAALRWRPACSRCRRSASG